MEDRRVAIDDEQLHSTLIKRAGATQAHSLPPEQAASPVSRPSSVQEFSIPSEQAAPSVHLPRNVQEPLLQSGFDTGDNCHQPMVSPWSPTDIAPEFQAQAWAILPNLAMALHNIKTARHQAGTATARGSPAINSHPEATQRLEGAKAFINLHPEAEGRNLIESSQEDIAIQNAILQSRIPASQKGKGQQVEEGIHGNQSTHSYAPATPPTLPVKSPSFESKDMWYHKLDLEEGWEPAKASCRKRLATEVNQSRSSPQSRDPLSGLAFFKNKMEGKCFNCFSQNHHAYSCNRPPRCWKCSRSGHRAMACPSNSRGPRYKVEHHHEQSKYTSKLKPSFLFNGHKVDHRSFVEVVSGKEGMAMARYPGDPRARPARGFCAVSATGDIRRHRDELIGRAVVCWLPGSSHASEPHHLGDALRNQLDIHHDDVQILKHFPSNS